VIAALLYVYSPYFALIAPHLLGDLPVVMGLALLPALLWSVDRLAAGGSALDPLAVTAFSAALILTEPRIAAVSALFALIWLLFHTRFQPRRWIAPFACMLLGALAAAFFWVPALVEYRVVTWITRLPDPLPQIDPLMLFTPLRALDPGELVHTPQFTLGVPALLFALTALIALLRGKTNIHGYFLLIAGILIALMIAFPDDIWLMGITAFALAVAGSGVLRHHARRAERFHQWRLPAAIAAIIVLSFPAWIAPRPSEGTLDTSPEAQLRYEELGYGIAVLPPDAPLPSPLRTTPTIFPSLSTKLPTVMNNAQIGLLSHATHSDSFQISLRASPISLQVLTGYFPGWSATYSANLVRVMPHPEDGQMLTLSEPERGELTLSLGATPPRTLAWVITWLVIGMIVLITRRRMQQQVEHYEKLELLSKTEARSGGALVLALLIVLGGFGSWALRPASDFGLEGSTALRARTDAGLDVLAYRLNATDAAVDVTLYWRSTRILAENYRVHVGLLDLQTGELVAPSAQRHPGGLPTSRWVSNTYVSDPYQLDLPAGGDYAVAVEAFAPDGRRLTFFAVNGASIGQTLVLPLPV